ncbi:MAG: hypothetical protein FJ150_09825 [Euryarchaeota archaeon]|nr:hypothetical protein [Euryarchaeota archaeon]
MLLGFTVVGFAVIYLVVSAILLIYSLFVCIWKFVLGKIEVDWVFWKFIIKQALPFGFTGIFVMIYYYIDTVMLSMILPNADELIGWYNAAYRLTIVLSFIPSVYFSSIFPIMSRFYKKSHKSLKFAFQR